MTEAYLGEIRIYAFNFPPTGWALCNGQELQINQNQALFALLGTNYGGNGVTTFALPNLQGRVPIHVASDYALGQAGGEAAHALTIAEMPAHRHIPVASGAAADKPSPDGNQWAVNANYQAYSSQSNESLSPAAVAEAGAGLPHENMSPYLALNFCIALMGVFPPRD
jgi:microcystin-dependent protein